MKKIKFSFIVPLAPLIFSLLIGLPLSCKNDDFFESLSNAHTTQITFYDQNPIENQNAKSVCVRYDFEHTFNINTEYPKDLKAGGIPEVWKYIDMESSSTQPPMNVKVDGEGKIQTVYVTQRALCFYVETWHEHTFAAEWTSDENYHWHAASCGKEEHNKDKGVHTATDWQSEGNKHWKVCTVCNKKFSEEEHSFSDEWEGDDTKHWHECSCGAKSSEEEHSSSVWKNDGTNHWKICDACGAKFSKAEHDWTSGSTCGVCGRAKEVAVQDLIAYLSDPIRKDTVPKVTVNADSSSDVASIKTALTDSRVTSNVAGVDIVLTGSITSIESFAFSGCTSLKSITIPEGVTSIEVYAFLGCTSLMSVTIPDSVESIGYGAFSGCTALSSVTIPSSVTTIGEWAFDKCTSLASVTIPEGVITIEERTFNCCTSLMSVTIPDSVESIGNGAFYSCTALSSVAIPSSVTTIGKAAFSGTSLESVAIPEGVITIEERTFNNCTSLSSVTIPSSVTTIGKAAFSGTSLESVAIPSSVTTIGDSAFSSCTSLASVKIPSSVTTIGMEAFTWCTSLESVTVEAETPPTLGSYAFSFYVSGTKIYVPTDSVDAYKTSWSDYADYIEAIPTP